MTKTLVCGDLHTKFHIFEKVKEMVENYDRVIFLGDYVDEWEAIPEASYNLLFELIEYKKQNMDKVILLWGNHDLSEWWGKPFACSGFNPQTHNLVADLLNRDDNWKLFQVAYTQDNILFTHAGVTQAWAERHLDSEDTTADMLADKLNWALLNRPNEKAENIFFGLAEVGAARGGYSSPSPLWTDEIELMADCLPGIEQVVGHTPQREIEIIDQFGKKLTFCDTHSLYPSGKPIGNSDLLEIVNGKKRIICLA